MKRAIFTLIFLLTAVSASAQCVSRDQLIEVLDRASMESQAMIGLRTIAAECDPCKCPTSMADCYSFMAEQERRKEEAQKRSMEIFDRFKKDGICK